MTMEATGSPAPPPRTAVPESRFYDRRIWGNSMQPATRAGPALSATRKTAKKGPYLRIISGSYYERISGCR